MLTRISNTTKILSSLKTKLAAVEDVHRRYTNSSSYELSEEKQSALTRRLAIRRSLFLSTSYEKYQKISLEKYQLIYKKVGIGYTEEELAEMAKEKGAPVVLPPETAERIRELRHEDPTWKGLYDQACAENESLHKKSGLSM